MNFWEASRITCHIVWYADIRRVVLGAQQAEHADYLEQGRKLLDCPQLDRKLPREEVAEL